MAADSETILHNARHPIISPDGRSIAVERSDDIAEGGWQDSPVQLRRHAAVSTGAPHSRGSRLRWQPDGTALRTSSLDTDGTSNIS